MAYKGFNDAVMITPEVSLLSSNILVMDIRVLHR